MAFGIAAVMFLMFVRPYTALATGSSDDIMSVVSSVMDGDARLRRYAAEKASSVPETLHADNGTEPDTAFVLSMGDGAQGHLDASFISQMIDAAKGAALTAAEITGNDGSLPDFSQKYIDDGESSVPPPLTIAETETIAAAPEIDRSAGPSANTSGSYVPGTYVPTGEHITRRGGVFYGPSGKETYYNLPMNGVVKIMRRMGYTEQEWPYWVREDGAKMLGDYIIVAANLTLRPRGTIVPTSLGDGIVCDTGGFAVNNPTQLDLALDW